MRKYLLLIAAAAASTVAAPAAHADCVEVRGNGSVIYSGPFGTLYGVDADTNPNDCIRTATDAISGIDFIHIG